MTHDDLLTGETLDGSPVLVAFFTAARGRAEPGELDGEERIVAAMAEALAARPGSDPGQRRHGRATGRLLAAKTTVAAVTLGIATAAAATGVAVTLVVPDRVDDPPGREQAPVTAIPPHGAETDASNGGATGDHDERVATTSTTAGTHEAPGQQREGSTGKPDDDQAEEPEAASETTDTTDTAGGTTTSTAPPTTVAHPGPPAAHGPPSDPGPPDDPRPPGSLPVPPRSPAAAEQVPPDLAGTATVSGTPE